MVSSGTHTCNTKILVTSRFLYTSVRFCEAICSDYLLLLVILIENIVQIVLFYKTNKTKHTKMLYLEDYLESKLFRIDLFDDVTLLVGSTVNIWRPQAQRSGAKI